MIVRRLVADDIERLIGHAAEHEVRAYADKPHDLTALVASPWGWSCWTDEPVAVGGILPANDHVGYVWGIVGRPKRRDVLPVCRVVRDKVRASPFAWVEMHVNSENKAARDFARACGFMALDAQDHEAAGLRFARMVYRKGILQ